MIIIRDNSDSLPRYRSLYIGVSNIDLFILTTESVNFAISPILSHYPCIIRRPSLPCRSVVIDLIYPLARYLLIHIHVLHLARLFHYAIIWFNYVFRKHMRTSSLIRGHWNIHYVIAFQCLHNYLI